MSGNGALMVAPPFPPEYRASGLLLHVTSLPSPYGVGDLGASAFSWIDRLHDAGLAWWQALPLGPTGYGNSPYQSMSSFAGNALLISPGSLISDGLLQASDAQSHFSADAVDYDSVIPFKQRLLEKAWANFQGGERRNNQLWSAYDEFCARQAHWLEDYALFRALKAKYHGAYYLEWPAELVQRSPSALAEARRELASQIDQVRFAQFLLFRQADQLKEHAHAKGVSLIGDLPFFVSPDSSDVWANPELFLLDEQHRPRFVAGVPPDYFSAQGQLWGNPVYNWECRAFDWLSVVHRSVACSAGSRRYDSLGSLPRVRGCVARSSRSANGSVRAVGGGSGSQLFSSSANRAGPSTIHRGRFGCDYGRRADPARPVSFAGDARPAIRLRWSCGQSISAAQLCPQYSGLYRYP